MKDFLKKVIFFFGLILAPFSTHAVDKIYITDPSTPGSLEFFALTEPESYIQKLNLYFGARNILFLGDGFFRYNTKKDHSLAEYVSRHVSRETQIWKTSLDCPGHDEGTKLGNILRMSLDHSQKFPFSDNQFDLIVMRKGLCYCTSKAQSCGGLNFKTFEAQQFFEEVVRVLNKNNPKSSVVLHGIFRSKIAPEPLSFLEEQVIETQIHEQLKRLEASYPQLKFEMIYLNIPVWALVETLHIDFSRILDNDGIQIKSKLNFEAARNNLISFLDGIRISVKPSSCTRPSAADAARLGFISEGMPTMVESDGDDVGCCGGCKIM